MAKFMLILRSDVTQDYSDISPEQFGEILAAYNAWGAKLEAEGRLQLGRKLTDEGGCVLQPQANGTVTTKDGPYVETKEVIGGVYVIDADDYAHAAKLCEGHPNFRFGSIEIRQLDFMGGPEQ
ncbi:MAG: transcription initiation protein [Planctomycetes bacterium]|nr:transcription initiation protein [Planctomycetota bacterium]